MECERACEGERERGGEERGQSPAECKHKDLRRGRIRFYRCTKISRGFSYSPAVRARPLELDEDFENRSEMFKYEYIGVLDLRWEQRILARMGIVWTIFGLTPCAVERLGSSANRFEPLLQYIPS